MYDPYAGGNGAGVFCVGGSPTFTNCVIENNNCSNGFNPWCESGVPQGWAMSGGNGAGLYFSNASPALFDCSIINNHAGRGGHGACCLAGCADGASGGHGGGVFLDSCPSALFDNCVISGNRAGRGGRGDDTVYGDGSHAGRGGGAGGVYLVLSTATFANCSIIDNVAGKGGNGGEAAGSGADGGEGGDAGNGGRGAGALVSSTDVLFANCAITDNIAGDGGEGGSGELGPGDGARGGHGGGAYVVASSSHQARFVNCLVADNTAGTAGNGGWSATGSGVGGDAGAGAGVYIAGSTGAVINSTIAGNVAGQPGTGSPNGAESYGAGVGQADGAIGTVANCILWGNQSSGTTEEQQLSGGTIIIDYSCVEGWTGTLGGAGNIGGDPSFSDPNNGDYYLTPGSPCVDAADNTAVPADEADVDGDSNITERTPLDLDGLDRFVDDPGTGDTGVADPPDYPYVVDMGAYEVDVTMPRICLAPATFEFFAEEGGSDPNDQTLSIWNCGFATLNWVAEEECSWLTVDPNSGQSIGEIDEVALGVNVSGLAAGAHTCTLNVVDPQAPNTPRTVLVTLYVTGTLHVPSVYPTIQDAIDTALEGDTVLVADGTYIGLGNKDLDFAGKGITVRSENGPASCTIDCEGDGRGFEFQSGETASAIVDGFTITNGGSVGDGAGIRCQSASNPTIMNCIITECAANDDGGGVYCDSSSPTIVNCVVSANTASDNGGGLQCITSTAIIANCTIAGNRADRGGGAHVQNTSDATITNCVFSGNTAPDGPEIRLAGSSNPSTLTISYTDVDGGQAEIEVISGCTLNWGDGNIDADPVFADPNSADYHLTAGSLCIDAGDNAAIPADVGDLDGDGNTTEPIPFDLDGRSRVINFVVDMGAYELRHHPSVPPGVRQPVAPARPTDPEPAPPPVP